MHLKNILMFAAVFGSVALASDSISSALRDVNEGLEFSGGYHQHHRVTLQEGDSVTVQSEWRHVRLASGDETVEVGLPAFGQTTTDYLVGGEAYTLSQSG